MDTLGCLPPRQEQGEDKVKRNTCCHGGLYPFSKEEMEGVSRESWTLGRERWRCVCGHDWSMFLGRPWGTEYQRTLSCQLRDKPPPNFSQLGAHHVMASSV